MKENHKSEGLNIALPNGSLEEGTMRLFEEAGFPIKRDPRKHDAFVDSPLIERVKWMRPQIMPRLVKNGVYDVGVCGLDCVRESKSWVGEAAFLRYGRGTSTGEASIVLVTNKDNPVQSIREIRKDSVILSEYPTVTSEMLVFFGLTAEVHFSYGCTEAHIPGDYEYGVCLTDTGASLVANGLKIIHKVMKTGTTLIVSPEIWLEPSRLELPEHPKKQSVIVLRHFLLGVLEAREKVLLKMNVVAEKKDAVFAVLPALKTPTIAPLADGKSFAIETVVPRKDANGIIIKAAQAGAEGILELPITKMIPKW